MISVYKINPPATLIHQCQEDCCGWKKLYDELINQFLIDNLDKIDINVSGLNNFEYIHRDLYEQTDTNDSEDKVVRITPQPVTTIYETDENEFS